MPPRNDRPNRFSAITCCNRVILLLVMAWHAGAVFAHPQSGSFVQVRSREIELHYHLDGTDSRAEIELWYTRDRGTTWQRYGPTHAAAQGSPLRFVAPAEGLYGFILIARDGARTSRPNPSASEEAQRWVFVDYTPPLAQWMGVDPMQLSSGEVEGAQSDVRPILQMRWTVYDNNLPARPVSLYYQSADEEDWKVIENQLPNVGQYLWTLPSDLSGQITLKLQVKDMGGHVVERLFGPTSVDQWYSSIVAQQPPEATVETSIVPSDMADVKQPPPVKPVSAEQNQLAREYYARGAFHWRRGEYALAAARFREALEAAPDMLEAMIDLAGIYCYQQDFSRAVQLYQSVIDRDSRNRHALLGAALAYSAAKQYPESRDMLLKLLESNERDAEAWLYLGDVLFQMGGLGEARRHWRAAMEVDASATRVIEEAREKLQTFLPADSAATADAKANR
ncbi:MAG: tetratricopeptide repeat protein [Phycisphaerales bacterium]|nr:tetratricopeptide repeat protein [Phycisphaerales bacterium]